MKQNAFKTKADVSAGRKPCIKCKRIILIAYRKKYVLRFASNCSESVVDKVYINS